MAVIDLEKPVGVIVQYGGQTPLKLARALEAAGAPIIGTSPDSIDLAEDRERFQKLVDNAHDEKGLGDDVARISAVASRHAPKLHLHPHLVTRSTGTRVGSWFRVGTTGVGEDETLL